MTSISWQLLCRLLDVLRGTTCWYQGEPILFLMSRLFSCAFDVRVDE